MTMYKVQKTYTPNDSAQEQKPETYFFESDLEDLYELAILAVRDQQPSVSDNKARNLLNADDVQEQLEGQDASDFEFMLFTNNGEWTYSVSLYTEGSDA